MPYGISKEELERAVEDAGVSFIGNVQDTFEHRGASFALEEQLYYDYDHADLFVDAVDVALAEGDVPYDMRPRIAAAVVPLALNELRKFFADAVALPPGKEFYVKLRRAASGLRKDGRKTHRWIDTRYTIMDEPYEHLPQAVVEEFLRWFHTEDSGWIDPKQYVAAIAEHVFEGRFLSLPGLRSGDRKRLLQSVEREVKRQAEAGEF